MTIAKDYAQLLDCSCNMIRSSARKITQRYESCLREAGIKPTQFTILAALANTGPVQLTQLAEKLSLERTGLTRNLTVLERNGWIRADVGAEDSRQRVISLSAEGFAQLDAAIPFWKKAQTEIADQVGGEDLNTLRTILRDMTMANPG